MRHAALALSVGLLALCGCGGGPISRFPDDPDELTVYSIDGPTWWRQDEELTPEQRKGEVLFGIPVLGKVVVSDADQRRAIMAAIREAAKYTGDSAKCFIPRHAVRTVKGGKVVHAVICFQCKNYDIYEGEDKARTGGGVISRDAAPVLDQLLKDAGVPLAPKTFD